MRTKVPALYRVAAPALFAYLASFVFLSIDTLVRIYHVRSRMPQATDAAAVLSLELAHALTIALGLALALLAWRQRRWPAARTFSMLIVFAGVWYAKTFAFSGFPGFVQERLANRLLGAGTSRTLLDFVFGRPGWALWLALGAFLRLSATWPRPLQSGSVARSGTADRAGLLRSSALAGADVGAMMRRAASIALTRGWLRPAVLWPVIGCAALAHSFAPWPVIRVLFDGLFGFILAIGITNARAASLGAQPRHRRRARWVAQAAVTVTIGFLLSGLLSLRLQSPTVLLSVAVASLTPFAALMALFTAITRRNVPDPAPALRRTITFGAAALAGTAAYAVLQFALSPIQVSRVPVPELAALGSSILLVAALRRRLTAFAAGLTAERAESEYQPGV